MRFGSTTFMKWLHVMAVCSALVEFATSVVVLWTETKSPCISLKRLVNSQSKRSQDLAGKSVALVSDQLLS